MTQAVPKQKLISVSDLKPPPGRPVDEKRVSELAESMARVGQLAPLNVVKTPKGLVIRLGLHRWLAARKLGWATIRCEVEKPDRHEITEEKVISENLIRLHMTAAERAEEIARLVKVRAAQKGTPPQGSAEKDDAIVAGTPVPARSARKDSESDADENVSPREYVDDSRKTRPQNQASATRQAIREVAAEKGLPEETVKKIVQRSEKRAEKEAAKPAEVSAPVVEPTRDERGQEIPAALVSRWNLHRESTAKIGNLFRAIQTELGKLKEDAGETWTQPMAQARALWGSIKVREPFAICAYCKGADAACSKCHGFGLQSEMDQQSTPKELLPS